MLHFKDFLPTAPPPDAADRVFIRHDQSFAAVIDGVSGCSYPKLAADMCVEVLESLGSETRDIPLKAILDRMHERLRSFSTARLMAVAALVRAVGDGYEVAMVGNLALVDASNPKRARLAVEATTQPLSALGQDGAPRIVTCTLPMPKDGFHVLATDGLHPQRLAHAVAQHGESATNADWRALGERVCTDSDWSFLVFPFERRLHFQRDHWPYDPFVGVQEGHDHERRGLAELADALFRSNRYPGFRILGSMTVDRARASYLADGVLVIPEGLVLLELKDHWGRIEIPLESGAGMRTHRREPESNPVYKLKKALRHISGWVPDLPLEPWQRKMAAVVFTNPGAQVFGVRASGQIDAAPLISGEVMVAGTARFPALLADFLKPFRTQSKGGRVRLLSPAEIEEVAGRLAAGQEEEAEDPEAWRIGSYSFDRKPAQETGYHALHTGRSNRGKAVLLKHYRLKSLMRGDRDAALAALGREAEILSELPQDPRLERLLGHGEDGDAYYVILEAVQAPDLDQWLAGDPPRAERLAILRDLAELLALLAEADVVHRGITPKSLRVRDGRPVLTGFELARLDSVATLLVDARRLFDQQYQAREVFVGGVLGPATDSYSLGALAIRMLAGTLPFRDFQELAVRRGKPGFWEKVAAGMALPPPAAADVKRLLSPDPIQRPTGRALVDLVSGWS